MLPVRQRPRGRLRAVAGGLSCIVRGVVLGSGGELKVVIGLFDATTGALLLIRSYTGQVATVMRIPSAIACSFAIDADAELQLRCVAPDACARHA